MRIGLGTILRYGGLCALALMLVGPPDGLAEGPPSGSTPLPPTATQPDPKACAEPKLPVEPPSRESDPKKRDRTVGQGDPLSDRLARTEGVICPPMDVDPGIKAPTPDVGRGRVIPPPGSPGGDPTVRPK